MPNRLKLVVAYDGTAFAGWQSQLHRNTVQDQLEHAFKRIAGAKVTVHGAGRTDAGVHALGQCAHVDLANSRLAANSWQRALNAILPATIRILRCPYVSSTFHARFSAKGKIYRYRIWSDEILPPLELNRAWHVARPINLDLAKQAVALFRGQHDFAAFAANRGKKEESTMRTIHSAVIRRRGPLLTIELDGDGFLYKMARLIVGTVVQCASGKLTLDQIRAALRAGRTTRPRLAAPSQGLYLVRVRY
jgi:tRNA pseudouridine38-40 synthase